MVFPSVYTMQMMLEVKHHIEQKMPHHAGKDLNYTKIGYIALGTFGKWAVNIAVLGCNLGVCAGYMIFISTNLQVRGPVWCYIGPQYYKHLQTRECPVYSRSSNSPSSNSPPL